MYMKDIEIVGSFKRADNQKEQVAILAELNVCEKQEIIEVLKKNGIDTSKVEEQMKPRKRPKRSKSSLSTSPRSLPDTKTISMMARIKSSSPPIP